MTPDAKESMYLWSLKPLTILPSAHLVFKISVGMLRSSSWLICPKTSPYFGISAKNSTHPTLNVSMCGRSAYGLLFLIDNYTPSTVALMPTLNLKLVGPFHVLGGLLTGVPWQQCVLHYRYFYDPPEFVTVLCSDDDKGFHLGYFRYMYMYICRC